jgi:hypothetical protein
VDKKQYVGQLIERINALMQRNVDAKTWGDLTEEDSNESTELFEKIEAFTEKQLLFQAGGKEYEEEYKGFEEVTDRENTVLNTYISWFIGLGD